MRGRCLRLSGASAVDHLSLRAVLPRKNYKLDFNDVCRQILSVSENLTDVVEQKYELLVFYSYFYMDWVPRNLLYYMITRKFISR